MQVNKTTLYFPKPLSAIYGNAMQWSYAGGFLKCVQTGAAVKSAAGCPVLDALRGRGSLALPHAAVCAAPLPAAESPRPCPWLCARAPCSCQGRRFTSSSTQFRLATLKTSAYRGDRRLSVSNDMCPVKCDR